MIRLLVALLLLLPLPALAQQTSFSPEQKKELENLVRDILVKNPQILVEAMQALERQQEERAAAGAKLAIKENAKEIFDDGVSYVAGNPKGDVTLVEFFDYRCGYCKQVQGPLLALLKEDSKLRVVLKELPVLGPDSMFAARAAIASQEQKGKYLDFHNAMMAHRGQLPESEVFRLAGSVGLDIERLKKDMAAPKVSQVIERNLALAQKIGVDGTPGFVIGEQLIPGAIPLETMRQVVKQQRGG
ncbi:DsbA family protein [Ferrovibrio sp.]|uniref:DsbA family protein n=1 Tax=Ferrovibrio sp. TaxID=1917215 RepID=UPI001B7983E0|nr:DsbA family protein [Ferrovibrio sp.]MBP7065145.1 DsbA family protein [Ferrovibrio sp.]